MSHIRLHEIREGSPLRESFPDFVLLQMRKTHFLFTALSWKRNMLILEKSDEPFPKY